MPGSTDATETDGRVKEGRTATLPVCAGVALALGFVSMFAASASSFTPVVSYTTGNGPVAVAVGDLNGDGKPDVATANLYANTVSMFLNSGNGSFQPRRDYATGGDPRSIAIGDLDGDGKPDLVTASNDANKVSVHLNGGNGSFQPRRDYGAQGGPVAVAIGDVNGDGRADMVTASRTDVVSVRLNQGSGSFRSGRTYRTGREPVSVAVADLNGDGKPDLIVANVEANTASVLLNNGDGSFQRKRDYATGRHPMSVAVSDVNGDRKPDFVTANLDADTVSVFLSRGDGTFNPRRDHRAGGDPRSVAIGDLDGDGERDIVTVNADASTVSVFRGRDDGNFPSRDDYVTGRRPVSVAISDLNDDGRADITTANLDAGAIAVLLAGNLVVSQGGVQAAPPPARGLLLWNKLGRAHEVTHSAYGPNLALFNCRDRSTPYFGRRCATDVQGRLAHPKGVFGRAAGITGGPFFSEARVHGAMLRASILNPERGAVEAWYRQMKNPVPYRHDQYRVFGGPYSLAGIDEVNLYSSDGRLHFALFFGEEPPPFVPPHLVDVRSTADGRVGYRIPSPSGHWIHVAGVWDRRGISGTKDRVRLYVNGKIVATSRSRNWGTTPCGRRVSARPAGACFIDVAGCNDTCANAFAVDNLKVWNYAKTDFSDRFKAGF